MPLPLRPQSRWSRWQSSLLRLPPPCRRLPLWQRKFLLPVAEPAAPAAEQASAAQQPAEAAEEAEEVEEPIVIEENAKVKAAVDYLREVITLMGVENVTFSAVQKGEATIIRLDGEKLGALIGRRGETMESLSYLASLVANRLEGDYIKLGLDVAGYRDKRESDLTALAQRIGAKVRKTGRSFAMEPMNPYERRIIHSAISKMEGVRSESKGEGRDRRVVIYSTAPDAQTENTYGERRGRGGNRNGRRPGRQPQRRLSRRAPQRERRPQRRLPRQPQRCTPWPASVQRAGAHLRTPRCRECSTRSTQAHRARGRLCRFQLRQDRAVIGRFQ